MLLLIILAVLVFGGFAGWGGHRQWGESNGYAGPGIGLGTILIILLVCWAMGVFR